MVLQELIRTLILLYVFLLRSSMNLLPKGLAHQILVHQKRELCNMR